MNKLDKEGESAEQIVNAYGEALSAEPGMAKPISSLKNSKDEIREAIKAYILSLKKAGMLNKEILKALSFGYASIDLFIDDKESQLFSYVEKLKDNTDLPEDLLNNYHTFLKQASTTMKENAEDINRFIMDNMS